MRQMILPLLQFLLPTVLLAGLTAWYLLTHPALQQNNLSVQAPTQLMDSYIQGVRLFVYQHTQLRKIFHAQQIEHFLGQENTQITLPMLQVMNTPDNHEVLAEPQAQIPKVIWEARALYAHSNADNSPITLLKQVVLRRVRSKLQQTLRTEKLVVYPMREQVETDLPFTIKTMQGTTLRSQINAVGLKADLAREHYLLLHQVRIKQYPLTSVQQP